MSTSTGKSFFPVFFTYPDTAFGDKDDPNLLGTAADFRDDPYLKELIAKEGRVDDLAAHPLPLRHPCVEAALAVPLQADLGS